MSSQLNWRILKHFSGKNMLGFTFQDVVKEFPENNRINLSRVLADMVKKGMLCKITRNNYHIIPFNADAKTYYPDAHQVAKYLMQNKEYYIGYASAMKIHGLTFQSEVKESETRESEAGVSEHTVSKARNLETRESERAGSETKESQAKESQARESQARESDSILSEGNEYVVTKKQIRSAIKSFGGTTYQFILHDETRFFGFESIWINQLEKAMVSDLEKTIVDIATKPQLVGGIVEVGNAIFLAKDHTDQDKLFYYFARNRNKSAKKRFLFLTDLLGMEWNIEHKTMMEEIGTGISLLDPAAPDQGKKRSKFGLKINVDPIHIKKTILQPKTF